MIIKRVTVGNLDTNCYLVGCDETKEAVVIDPGADGGRIIEELKALTLNIRYIINTHGHADHTGANKVLKDATGSPVLIHAAEESLYKNPRQNLSDLLGTESSRPGPDRFLNEGEQLHVGSLTIEVIATPGHTPGGICLLVNGEALFSGDTLFSGAVGRTDLPGGSHEVLLHSIKGKLFSLHDDTKVYPGHMDETTIGREKEINPFLQ